MNSIKNTGIEMNRKYSVQAFKRMCQVLKERNIDNVAFQDKIGVRSQHWTNWAKNGLPSSRYFIIADLLEVNAEWLVKGTGDKYKTEGANENERKSKVPMIAFNQVRAWIESDHVDIKEYMSECPVKHTDRAFAMRVVNDSMTSSFPGMRSYLVGCIIYVDPGVQVISGCRVIVGIKDSIDSRFREYLVDGGEQYLKPLNQQYPTQEMTDESITYGVVIGMYMPE
ncbi:MAG: LexA family protein [Methylococcaceae bacterium]